LTGRNILHAVNVHQGGGCSLLLALLAARDESRVSVALLDSRLVMNGEAQEGSDVRCYRPTILSRLQAEWWLYRNVGKDDTVLCFGNLPPLFSLQGRVVVYVQNRYLIEDKKLLGFSIRVKLRLLLERAWLKSRAKNIDEFVVQTPSMKYFMERHFSRSSVVSIRPFVADAIGYQRSSDQWRTASDHEPVFLYVASAEPHKNHKVLIDAWCLLVEEGLSLKLLFTFDEATFSDVADYLTLRNVGLSLKIQNLGSMPHSSIVDLYNRVDALIYPSNFESYGLPLIEARQAGLDILAPEMDYVRDLVDPESSFDPASAVSIAKSVKRYLGVIERPLKIVSAKEFLLTVFKN
jgi:glycosyltransferase involved in cell wall biosynthesis